MNFSTEDILRALREGATDADLATEFAKSLNEATKLHTEETAKARAAEAEAAAKEALYENCANAFTDVLKAEGIDEPVSAKDIHAIVDSIKNADTFIESLVDSLDKALSAFEKPKKRGKRAECTINDDDEILKSFLSHL